MTSDDVRHRHLLRLKLRALVRDHTGRGDVPEAGEFAPGAALVHDGVAWLLLDERPDHRLGAALAWWLRSGAERLAVIADRSTGLLARRAAEFDVPVEIWHVVERELLPAAPEPFPDIPSLSAHHAELRPLIVEAGAEPVVEHGVLTGEVRGLEVCRVVDDPHLGTTRLEVGVGAHDREAFQMIHGDVPPVDSLARIVRVVAEHRRVGAPPHPLNRIAAERFVRWRTEQEPALVGARRVDPAEPPVARPNLKDPVPCVAVADPSAVVVCTSGVDLEVIPYAADARMAAPGAGGGLVVALPVRDRLRVIDELAARLRRPVQMVSID